MQVWHLSFYLTSLWQCFKSLATCYLATFDIINVSTSLWLLSILKLPQRQTEKAGGDHRQVHTEAETAGCLSPSIRCSSCLRQTDKRCSSFLSCSCSFPLRSLGTISHWRRNKVSSDKHWSKKVAFGFAYNPLWVSLPVNEGASEFSADFVWLFCCEWQNV